MRRGARSLVRYGLPATDAVEADLATIGLLPDGEYPASQPASGESVPGEPTAEQRSAAILTDAGRQAIRVALSRAGRPELAVQHLAGALRALRAYDCERPDGEQPNSEQPSGDADAAQPNGDQPDGEQPSGDADAMLDAIQSDAGFRGRLIGLCGASEPLGELLAIRPGLWCEIAADAPWAELTSAARCRAALDAAIRGPQGHVLGIDDAIGPLREAYRARLAVIAAADVAPAVEPGVIGPELAEVCQALTILADALLATALALAEQAHPADDPVSVAVVAMGKCGARELNYVSDVDVMIVAGRPTTGSASASYPIDRPDQQPSGTPTLSPAQLRIATLRATDIMQICQRVAWEVDAGLRPEGQHGPLVRTVESYRAYYERWAKTWEFQALLKARPAAGDIALGEELLTVTRPEVWQAADRESFVADVQAMRRRVQDAIPVPDRAAEFKLGVGGLRDVEFAVQLLQLVHGRGDESLRVPGTLEALQALTDGGYVGRSDSTELADAYIFQRRIEHLLQLQHLLRTHSLPADADEREWLARTDGYVAARHSAGQRLAAGLAKREATVRRLHEKLFYRPLLDAVAAVPTGQLRLTPDAARHRLAALGFAAPEPALRHIAALTEGVSRRAAIQRTLLPVLFSTFADAPDPDAGLLGYRQVSDALAHTPWYLRLLRDEGLVADRLATLLGTSRLVADLLPRAPEVLKLLAHDDDLVGSDDPMSPSAVAASGLLARASRAATAAGAVTAARSARRHELLRLAFADLLGLVDTSVVTGGLTAISDAVVQAALQAAHREVEDQRDGPTARVAAIAMGRFGGAEMSYSSDADLLFVAGAAHPDADPDQVLRQARAIAELASGLVNKPGPAPLLHIDTDLRPEGRSGPLVRTVESYRQFWQRNVQPWHRQALLRARPVGGEDDLTTAFFDVIDPLRYPDDGLSDADAREVRRIKARVDTERLPRGADPALHTKLGRGGLADIEWTVQLMQLQHAGQIEALQQPGTLGAIDAAVEADLMAADDGVSLHDAWLMVTQARNAIMLVTGKPGDEIPSHGPVLSGIAQACGYGSDVDPGEFIDDYRRATRHARRVVDELFDRD